MKIQPRHGRFYIEGTNKWFAKEYRAERWVERQGGKKPDRPAPDQPAPNRLAPAREDKDNISVRTTPVNYQSIAVRGRRFGREFRATRFPGSINTYAAERLRNEFGLPLGEFLGKGEFSHVFRLEGTTDRVVKVTVDPTDAAAWANVQKHAPSLQARRQHFPCLATVYDVFCLDKGKPDIWPPHGYVFVIVQEFTFDLVSTGLFLALDAWSQQFVGFLQTTNPEQDRSFADLFFQDMVDERRVMTAEQATDFLLTLRNLRQIGFISDDIRGANVRERANGNLVITDLGYSYSGPVKIPRKNPRQASRHK